MIALFRDPTAAEIAAGTPRTNNQIRIPITYRGLTINNDTYEVSSIAIQPAYDAVTEPRTQVDGLEAYEVRKIQTVIQANGIVRAASMAALYDAIDALNEAFDPVLSITQESFPNVGFRDLKFSYPTADTDNYADGLIPMLYRARPLAPPVAIDNRFTGLAAPYKLILLCADPRRMLQTADTASRTGTGTLTFDNTLASYGNFPVLTFTLTGEGGVVTVTRPANLVTRTAASITLDLTGLVSGQVVVVNCVDHTIQVDGDFDSSVFSSGEFFDIGPRSSYDLAVTGTLNGTLEVSLRRAFV